MKTTDQFKYSEWMVDGRHEMLADTLIALWDGMDLLLILHQQSSTISLLSLLSANFQS